MKMPRYGPKDVCRACGARCHRYDPGEGVGPFSATQDLSLLRRNETSPGIIATHCQYYSIANLSFPDRRI